MRRRGTTRAGCVAVAMPGPSTRPLLVCAIYVLATACADDSSSSNGSDPGPRDAATSEGGPRVADATEPAGAPAAARDAQKPTVPPVVRIPTCGEQTLGDDAGLADDCPIAAGRALVIAEGLASGPTALGTDGLYVYWLEYGTRGQNDGVVMRAPISGGAPERIASAGGNPEQYGGHVAVSDKSVFWGTVRYASFNGQDAPSMFSVMRAPKSGGDAVSLADYPEYPPSVTDIIVLGGSVYWVAGVETIERVPVDGEAVETLTGRTWLFRIAADQRFLYFTESSAGGDASGLFQGMEVHRVSPHARNVELIYSSNEWGVGDEADVPSIAANGTHVAFTVDRSIRVVSRDGGEACEIATVAGRVTSLAMDADHVYWGTYPAGGVVCAPLSGGSVSRVDASVGQARGLTVRDGFLYWLDGDFYPTPGQYRVMRASTQ